MRSATFLLATLPALASAHSHPRDIYASLPKTVGGSKFMTELKSRNFFNDILPVAIKHRDTHSHAAAKLKPRFTETCGPGVGSCDAGYCCSPSGYCGTTSDYCNSPNCQFQYGPGCDANKRPAGASTSTIPRPHIGSIPYGGVNTAGIQHCTKTGVIAFTYDDGPYLYTKDLVDLLDSYGAKATFFITGNNIGKGEIDDCKTGYPQLIKRMYNSGHQIASHTWSHQDLSTLTSAQFEQQMYYNEMAFRNILGVIPTYMRPPYSSCNANCSGQLNTMGYHVTFFDLDSQGYLHTTPDTIQGSKDIFANAITKVAPATNDYLLVEHDIHYQVVYNLTKFMLESMKTAGWGAPVTVGECLGDPEVNWYRAAGNAIATCAAGVFTGVLAQLATSTSTSATNTTSHSTSTATATSPTSVSTSTSTSKATTSTAASTAITISKDGSCGGTITCQGSAFGNCCSQYGWCGNTTGHCGPNCQTSFGTCDSTCA